MNLVKVDPACFEEFYGLNMKDRQVSVVEPCVTLEDRANKKWIILKDRAFCAFSGAETPPIWLYRHFKWGPHSWPVRWREILKMQKHDCGLMAALTTEIYRSRGECAVSVQMILSFNKVSTAGWANLWRNQKLDLPWCGEEFAYHEGTAIIGRDGQVRIWDPLGRFWLRLHKHHNYEGIVTFKLCAPNGIIPLVRHYGCRIPINRWLSHEQSRSTYRIGKTMTAS